MAQKWPFSLPSLKPWCALIQAGQPSAALHSQLAITLRARRQISSILSPTLTAIPPPGTESKMKILGGSSWLSTARELTSRLSQEIRVGSVAMIAFETPERQPCGCRFCILLSFDSSSTGRSNHSPSLSNVLSGRSSDSSPMTWSVKIYT